jgi:glutathione S-transferase
LKINPAGVVPSIQDGDFNLGEAAAILEYLADSRGLSNWYPTDLKARAKVNYWLHWHHGALRRSTTKILIPAIHKTPPSEEELESYRKNLTYLNTHLGTSTFVASEAHPTIADLMLVPELDQLTDAAFALFDYSPYPNIVRYLDSIKTAVSSYEEVFAPVAAQTIIPRGNASPTTE